MAPSLWVHTIIPHQNQYSVLDVKNFKHEQLQKLKSIIVFFTVTVASGFFKNLWGWKALTKKWRLWSPTRRRQRFELCTVLQPALGCRECPGVKLWRLPRRLWKMLMAPLESWFLPDAAKVKVEERVTAKPKAKVVDKRLSSLQIHFLDAQCSALFRISGWLCGRPSNLILKRVIIENVWWKPKAIACNFCTLFYAQSPWCLRSVVSRIFKPKNRLFWGPFRKRPFKNNPYWTRPKPASRRVSSKRKERPHNMQPELSKLSWLTQP